jgi:cytoskeletal protein CcmA (bactofilin family)
MAIVLEVSLSLNPNNQIAYLGDFTSLIVDTEYLINGTYLTYDTRFTFRGNLDITLTKPPIGVPQAGTIVPAEITTVPEAAPAPLPVTYPYSAKDRINAAALNLDFEFSPGAVPPHSTLGGAGKYKYWVDTSTTMPSLRQCVVPRASTTYNAAEWITIGTIDAVAGKFHFNGTDVDFVGGEGGGSTIFNVTNLTVVGSTNLTTLNVTGTSTLSGATTIGGILTVPSIAYSGTPHPGHRFSFDWDGSVEMYVDGTFVGTVGRITNVAPGNGLNGGGASGNISLGMSGSYSGDFFVSGRSHGGSLYSFGNIDAVGSIGAQGNISCNGSMWMWDVNSGGTVNTQYVSASQNINANGRVDAGYIYSRGNIDLAGSIGVGNQVQCSYVHSRGGIDVDANLSVNGEGHIHGTLVAYYNLLVRNIIYGNTDGVLNCGSHFTPINDGGFYCGLSAWGWAGVVSYNFIQKSSAELKGDIKPVETDKCLDIVKSLNPVTYRYNAEKLPEKERAQTHCGFTAQDVLAVLEQHGLDCDVVHRSDDGEPMGLAYNELIGLLWGAVKSLTARVEQLESA